MKYVNEQQAEDIVQDSFIKLYETQVEDVKAARVWMADAILKRVWNMWRSEKIHKRHHKEIYALASETESVPEYHAIDLYVIGDISDLIDALPLQEQRVVRLYLKGMNTTEIAARLGNTRKTVCNLKLKACHHIRIQIL